MSTCTRSAVAVHVLTALAGADGQPMTSAYIAESVNTNPVVIRRILAYLRKQKLVESKPGTGGGWKLTRDPKKITLREVYRAVETGPMLTIHHRANRHCVVGRCIKHTLAEVFAAAQNAMEESLAQTTIAAVWRDVQARAAA